MPAAKTLVIFTQTYDLLTWLVPQCEHFPKSQRFVVTQRLLSAALDFQESIFEANARSGCSTFRRPTPSSTSCGFTCACRTSGAGSAVASTSM